MFCIVSDADDQFVNNNLFIVSVATQHDQGYRIGMNLMF